MKRRTLLAGLGVLVAAAAGGAAFKLRLFRKRYPPSPYDDLLGRLLDRDWAEKFGAAVRKAMPDFTPAEAAIRLRAALGGGDLERAARADASAGRVLEISGWLVPESAALLAGLAASQA